MKLLKHQNLLEIETKDINFKIAKDFINYWNNHYKLDFSNDQIEFLIQIIKATTSLNNRISVDQSDLFSILHTNINDQLKTSFYEAMNFTMFRELNYYLQETRMYKENIEQLYLKKSITNNEIDHCNKLIKWIDKKVLELQNSINIVLNNQKLKDSINYDLLTEFYQKQVDEKIRRFKWYQNTFMIVVDC
ncbi:hypothetical protein [Mycoplasma sp. HU2014]|uniref:hypothetical protein n=1 Tax=Mycoplasma sp. HU2014 TaxID=1664275 RepID=UPI00067D8737|nr:hypothetical protein [Mycoplasma sp. HU2014]KNG79392.1 hypothetical protein AB668_02425 [Mycoplasma sp. HU2014]